MGHYASEMCGPSYKRTPEQIEEDRLTRKERRQFLWDLHTQYREQGEYVKADNEISCPECTARVSLADMQDHEVWHQKLMTKMIVGQGLTG